MSNSLTAVLVLAILGIFLAILAWWVPRIDLVSVIVVTYLLAAYDFYVTLRSRSS